METIREPLFYAQASCDTMMRKFAPEDLPPKGHFHYHQGVFLSGVLKTWRLTGEEKYYEYAKAWVDSCLDENGKPKDFNPGQLDDIQPGILLYPLLDRTGDERYRKALDLLLPVIRDFPRCAEGGFWHKQWCPEQMWLDGLYMAGPISAEYAARFNAPEYFDICAQQALLMRQKTEDPATGLWYHAWDASKQEAWADPETGLAPEFWGRSIGWVPVAVLDELDFIPADYPQRDALETLVRDLLKAVCRFQPEDGRWYQVVDKVDHADNWPENSCSCLYVAALCKAVRKGLLDPSYLEIARRGYEGVIRSLEWETDADGNRNLLVGNVCVGTGVGDYQHYINRPVSTNDLHGVGAFLIMTAEATESGIYTK